MGFGSLKLVSFVLLQLCVLSALLVLQPPIAVRAIDLKNWPQIFRNKIQWNKQSGKVDMQEWREEIVNLKWEMSADDDNKRMSFLSNCVESKSEKIGIKLAGIKKPIEEKFIVSCLAKRMRVELGLLYPFDGELIKLEDFERELRSKVVDQCAKVHDSIGSWRKKLTRVNYSSLNQSQLKWLRLEMICTEIISRELTRTVFFKLVKQNKLDLFRLNQNGRAWFAQQIPNALKYSEAARNYQVLNLMVDSIAQACETDSDRESLHKTLPKDWKSALWILEEEEEWRKIKPACKYVHLALNKWWQKDHLEANLSKQDLKWLTIENICKNFLAE